MGVFHDPPLAGKSADWRGGTVDRAHDAHRPLFVFVSGTLVGVVDHDVLETLDVFK
jgi:hypothetical protein